MTWRPASWRTPLWVLATCCIVLLAPACGAWSSPPRVAPPQTSSAEGAWFEVRFTAPRYPESRDQRSGGVDERLVALMDQAQASLDVASYEFDLESVSEAMARAARRGVQVRMVTDTSTLEDRQSRFVRRAFDAISSAKIKIVDDKRPAIMHHKFTIVDGEWVQTGSWNYTNSETYRNNNNLLIIRSRQLAENFSAEFEKMFAAGEFGARKTRGAPHPSIELAGARLETYFSPQDRGASQIIRWLGSAQRTIHFLAFSFTHDGIGDAMLQRARAGVEVGGVFETSGGDSQLSEYRKLKQGGTDVLLDGNPWTMHHKVIVIDSRITIAGSFNFSNNADRQNDENLLIVEDAALAQQFEAEYQRVRQTALNPPARG